MRPDLADMCVMCVWVAGGSGYTRVHCKSEINRLVTKGVKNKKIIYTL